MTLASRADTTTKYYRSAITNRPLELPEVDGRSVWGRRRRDLIRELSAELGRRGQSFPLSAPTQLLVNQCASVQCRIEQLQVCVAKGEAVNDEQLVRLVGTVARLLTSLGLTRLSDSEPKVEADGVPFPPL